MKRQARLAGVAIVILALGASLSPAQLPKPDPQVDVVARTAVRLNLQHTRMIQQELVRGARQCLGGLVAETVPLDDKPQDGATRYRLFIEHTATYKVAKAPLKATLLTNDDYYSLFIVTQEQGAYKFRLMEWGGGRYKPVQQWGGPFTATHHMGLQGKVATSREMPALRERALLQTTPTSVTEAILGRLLPIKITESRGSPGAIQNCQLLVTNASPWPLTALDGAIRWPEPRLKGQARYEGGLAWSGELAPGKQVTLSLVGKPLKLPYRWQYDEPVEMDVKPVFAPLPPEPETSGKTPPADEPPSTIKWN